MREYIDLVILTNGSVCRAPGFSSAKPGCKVAVQGYIYEALDVASVPESEALLTLPKATGIINPLEYDEDEQEENADV